MKEMNRKERKDAMKREILYHLRDFAHLAVNIKEHE